MLMCCAHRVCISGVSDNTCFTLVKMMALLPDGEGIIFLRSLMKNEAMSRFVNACKYFTYMYLLLMQAPSDKIVD